MANVGAAGGAYLAEPIVVAGEFGEAASFSSANSLRLPTGVAVSDSLGYG
jgi:hypothetical protein